MKNMKLHLLSIVILIFIFEDTENTDKYDCNDYECLEINKLFTCVSDKYGRLPLHNISKRSKKIIYMYA